MLLKLIMFLIFLKSSKCLIYHLILKFTTFILNGFLIVIFFLSMGLYITLQFSPKGLLASTGTTT